MAGDDAAAQADEKSVGERFPALRQLEEDAERAKLEQALNEARAKAAEAQLPSLDVEVARDQVTTPDKVTGLARVLLQMDTEVLADDIAEVVLDAALAGVVVRPAALAEAVGKKPRRINPPSETPSEPSFEQVFGETNSLEGGPDRTLSRSQRM